jgi:IS4 transposase
MRSKENILLYCLINFLWRIPRLSIPARLPKTSIRRSKTSDSFYKNLKSPLNACLLRRTSPGA